MSEQTPEVDALAGLHRLLGVAVGVLKQPQMKLYLLIIKESGPPEVVVCEAEADVIKNINKLQKLRDEDPEANIFVQLFEGKRWTLVKGISPGFKCGDKFIPFRDSQDGDDIEDITGSLS